MLRFVTEIHLRHLSVCWNHESIGMQKYQQMKGDARSSGIHKKLDVGFKNYTVNT
jgi:hypothetical protein